MYVHNIHEYIHICAGICMYMCICFTLKYFLILSQSLSWSFNQLTLATRNLLVSTLKWPSFCSASPIASCHSLSFPSQSNIDIYTSSFHCFHHSILGLKKFSFLTSLSWPRWSNQICAFNDCCKTLAFRDLVSLLFPFVVVSTVPGM
jgi:hypothetical protein